MAGRPPSATATILVGVMVVACSVQPGNRTDVPSSPTGAAVGTETPTTAASLTRIDGDADLAAMLLRPSDVGGPYAILDGRRVGIESEAQSLAERTGTRVADARGDLSDLGYLRGQELRLAIAESRPDRGLAFERAIRSYVTLFASADGARRGFDLLEDESQRPSSVDVPGTRTVGEKSEITRTIGTDAGGAAFESLDLAFQTENISAGVTVRAFEIDGDVASPKVEEVERLADMLLRRIAAINSDGSPELGRMVLRPDLEAAENRDLYVRLGGEDLRLVTPLPYALMPPNAPEPYGMDVYQHQAQLGSGRALTVFDVRISRFASDEAAAGWLNALAADPGSDERHIDLEELGETPSFGDESVGFSYGYPVDEQFALEGYAVYLRSGAIIAGLDLVGVDIEFGVIEELAQTQAMCIETEGCAQE